MIGLFFGGKALLRGSVGIAKRLGMSSLLIGLADVDFGTSPPESLVSMQAVLADMPAIAIGNTLGSEIANILLVGGLTSLLSPIHV